MDCTWNNPGADPLRGPVTTTVAAAVARYDLPAPVRAELVAKVRNGLDDGLIEIRRTGLHSATGTARDLRDMQYGTPGRVCPGPVDRSAWPDGHVERALLYCSQGECIVVPVVCQNVSRVTWTPHAAPGVGVVPGPQPVVYHVPEPGSLALVLAGVALAVRRAR